MPKSESLLLLFALSFFFKERRERFTLNALDKRVTMKESLPSLFTKERSWAICSRCSWQKSDSKAICSFSWANRYLALSLTITSNFLEKPMSEFLTLRTAGWLAVFTNHSHYIEIAGEKLEQITRILSFIKKSKHYITNINVKKQLLYVYSTIM